MLALASIGTRHRRRYLTSTVGLAWTCLALCARAAPPAVHTPPAIPIAYQQPATLPPVVRANDRPPLSNPASEAPSGLGAHPTELESALLGGVTGMQGLPPERRARTFAPATDAVLGNEARSRETSDAGSLLGKSLSARSISVQQRTPIVTDTRIRAERVGQVLASGSFWAPVRMDLDTMLNKLDSRLIGNVIVVKGPYSPRFGPGFSFIDIDLLATPRFDDGYDSYGSTSLDYQTNGEQWYGRQTLWGGNDTWGFRVSYGHRAGNDYETGAGFTLPSSYNSGDLNVALGFDLSEHENLEFNYLRLDQSDLEFPGLVYDLQYLVTDGYELKYNNTNPGFADRYAAEIWYNRTRFAGDTFAASKQAQMPQLQQLLFSPSGVDGQAITDGDGLSMGYRSEATWGELGVDHWSVGTDLIVLDQELNDIEILAPPGDNNYPLPRSRSTDIGFYLERVVELSDCWQVSAGSRADIIHTNARDQVDGVPTPISDLKDAGLEQNFFLGSAYINSSLKLTQHWTGNIGFGYAQRPPTLTELYVDNAFLGSLQRGLTFLDGDPLLSPERLKQFDLGLRGQYEQFQGGLHAYYAWIHDFITYDLNTDPVASDDGLGTGASFVNTDLAVLRGVEAYGRYDWRPDLAFFANLSYVEGQDRSREKPARLESFPRSSVVGVPSEPLPGIAPLDSRFGLLWHDATPDARWGVELACRAVARQDRIAATLSEIATPSFITFDIRSYRRLAQRCLLTGGVENLTDRFYREHLDYRSGFGVFRPGINFYSGLELTY